MHRLPTERIAPCINLHARLRSFCARANEANRMWTVGGVIAKRNCGRSWARRHGLELRADLAGRAGAKRRGFARALVQYEISRCLTPESHCAQMDIVVPAVANLHGFRFTPLLFLSCWKRDLFRFERQFGDCAAARQCDFVRGVSAVVQELQLSCALPCHPRVKANPNSTGSTLQESIGACVVGYFEFAIRILDDVRFTNSHGSTQESGYSCYLLITCRTDFLIAKCDFCRLNAEVCARRRDCCQSKVGWSN